jgi:hypothetical protein
VIRLSIAKLTYNQGKTSMKKGKKVVLSEENINLLVDLAETLGSAKEVREDPNFALSLLLNRMKERPGGTVVGVRLASLAPTAIEGARERAARKRAA